MTNSVAARFADAYSKSGLSTFGALDELAGKKKPGHAAAIAHGRRVNPRPSAVRGYCRVLGISVAYLLLGDGERPSADAIRSAVEEAARAHRRRKHVSDLTTVAAPRKGARPCSAKASSARE